ncbi:serine hydrolase [Mangrovivirga sp. M17]|uniref:Serine hydrolase n=1 Tax=Mangrovivirga halotolerans TaxID=2993936 RepID=A0ABT3RUU9_9BACT|nr:serine hydrolase domain-containing protein [Mangrovivirga halotolerans]MCX2745347.1 serine hydrolase [Mangrovivirga halotolerans]
MKHFFTLLLIITSPFLNAQNFPEKIDSLINASFKTGVFNGNILVHYNDKLIYSNSLGYADSQRTPLASDHSMPIGSISKEFGSVGIMFLAEQGKVNIDEPLINYLDFLPEYCSDIKVSQILNYTSGIIATAGYDTESLKESLSEAKELKFNPGTRYDYNYSNIILQKALIEKLSGMTFKDFLEKRLFNPIGIDQIYQPENGKLYGKMAESFNNDGENTTFIHDYTKAIYLTPDDLHQWLKSLYNEDIISFETISTLNKTFDKGSQSGLGHLSLDSLGVLEHYHHGSGNNYEAIIYYSRELELEIILMTNNLNFKLAEIGNGIINIMQNKPFKTPKRSVYLDIREKLNDDFESGIAFYHQIRTEKADSYDLDNQGNDLIKTAQYLMRREKYTDAATLLNLGYITCELNKNDKSSFAELIADCYSSLGKNELAKIYYQKSILFNASNKGAQNKLNDLI